MTRAALFAVALAGCATAGSRGDTLAEAIAGRVAGAEENCISTTITSDVRVIDARTIVYRSGSTTYVNRLESACPGLRPLATVVTEIRGGQLCRDDWVRALEPGLRIPGPYCRLSGFTPYRLSRDNP